ncbi:MAG: hypothetical protein V4699_01240 [Patescibacteria group bacterium]
MEQKPKSTPLPEADQETVESLQRLYVAIRKEIEGLESEENIKISEKLPSNIETFKKDKKTQDKLKTLKKERDRIIEKLKKRGIQ